jgi:excisionase family DNA binding protein
MTKEMPAGDLIPQTLKVAEAARFLGLSLSSVYEAIGRKEIPSLRFGRRIVVPRAALMRLLEFGIQTPRSSNEEVMRTALELVVEEFDEKTTSRTHGLLSLHEPPSVANAREVLNKCSDKAD